jgi:hypothetical protein
MNYYNKYKMRIASSLRRAVALKIRRILTLITSLNPSNIAKVTYIRSESAKISKDKDEMSSSEVFAELKSVQD